MPKIIEENLGESQIDQIHEDETMSYATQITVITGRQGARRAKPILNRIPRRTQPPMITKPDLAEVMMPGSPPDRMVEAKRQIEQIKRDLDLSNDDISCVYGLMMRDQALRSSSPPSGRMKG